MRSVGKKIVAIASSTGGPKALQELIPLLPSNLNAPVCIVQHMPAGFTGALAWRLDEISSIKVSEAVDGETVECGHAYISIGGKHLNLVQVGNHSQIRYSDEPHREGVKPSANFMYESLIDSDYEEIICVVLTGMGQDGTVGIRNLAQSKKTTILAQNEESCTVFGMPKAIVKAGLSEETYDLKSIARKIIENVGVF